MVTAALKFSSSNPPPVTYASPDASRLDILTTLNWHEAHAEYTWPDFGALGFDFSQIMRFRRALVNDVFVALQKAGHVKIAAGEGLLGTPDSTRQGRRESGKGKNSSRILLEPCC